MLQLEGKDYDPGQFLQMNGLLTYLGDLNQAHNDLRDLVSKLQLQLENKDKRIKELRYKLCSINPKRWIIFIRKRKRFFFYLR